MSDATCRICGKSYSERGMTRHLQSCLAKHADAKKSGVHLKVTDPYNSDYWLQLVAARDATLEGLDNLLRNVWLECCGHLSEFEIDGVRYDPCGGGDSLGFGPPVRSADVPIVRVLDDGAEFAYAYDFGSTTHLEGRSYGAAPWPADLAVESPESVRRIIVLARNEAPVFECTVCGKPAAWVCTECQWEAEGFLCQEHARTHECGTSWLLPVVNSPRMGVCDYSGPSDAMASEGWEREDEPTRSGREVVDELFEEPPVDEAELAYRIGQADADELLAALVDRAERGDIGRGERAWVMAIFGDLGLGDQLERLQKVVADPDADEALRRFAFAALSGDERVDMDELVGLVGEGEVAGMLADSMATLLGYAEEAPELFMQVADMLLASGAEQRDALFGVVEEQRHELGLDAGLVYRAVLAEPAYEPLWPILGAAVVEDAVVADAELLEDAAAWAESDEVERTLRRQALELRTSALDGGRHIEGVGLFGSCDGSGAFPIFLARKRSDGSLTVINLLFRTTGELRDGFAADFEGRDELAGIQEAMRAQAASELLEVPVEVAAALCHERLERAEAQGTLPDEFSELAWRVRRLPADDAAVRRPPEAREQVSLERTRQLLSRPQCQYWFVDITELIEADVEAPPNVVGSPDEAWFDAALARLAEADDTVERVASLAEHTAQWHALAEDDTLAAEFASLAEHTRRDPAHSPLMRGMLEKGLQGAQGFEEGTDIEAGRLEAAEDAELRRAMRHRFFSGLEVPVGFDVVHLATSCASFVLLESLFPAIADSRQPRPEQLYELAYELGEVIAAYLTNQQVFDEDELPMLIAQQLAAHGLVAADLARVLPPFLDQMQVYFDFVAPEAFFAAMQRPETRMAEAFYR
ncbi:plasmid pRiA4b ORF-3 family protein [Persicimonas caeni]|uniref:Plasmid pRiA4b ORF-3 family protein n=1 Tax=Persicimonas caeni TaxID=2292766 RepID=A0A4Y6PVY0_PERCE|nr:plasmid pRiA4b ORF-3 family protein [Persicimonas caeni]QDG52157.1 plasmid pRiA4b ORF-3 family protein [Persicimonas caeni]QED33379.1 plasmid pRiA4b ORF-3 family protein [Persicimonas caeni]